MNIQIKYMYFLFGIINISHMSRKIDIDKPAAITYMT